LPSRVYTDVTGKRKILWSKEYIIYKHGVVKETDELRVYDKSFV
jgi:hypothetical protein